MPPRDDANASLSAEGIAFMRVVNPYLPFLRPDDRSNYTLRQAAIGKVMALTPGPNFHPGPEVLDQITEHYAAGNAALVEALGDGPEWADWLAQPIHSGKPPVAVPQIRPERVAELMVAISEPDGPVAWGRPAGRPVRVKELVRDAGRRYVGGITAKAKQLRQR
jgi:hypothetical protein